MHCRLLKVLASLTLLAASLIAGAAQPGTTSAVALELGRAIEQSLKGGETHTYYLSMARGQFAKVIAYQKGVDLVLRAHSPGQKTLGEVDSPNGTLGPEPFTFTSDTAGIYRFEVSSLDPQARVGRYTITLVILLSPEETREASIIPAPAQVLDRYAGGYQIARGHLITISNNDYAGGGGHLALVDHRTRAVKALRPHTETHFFSGPRPSLEYPVEEEYSFVLGPEGDVRGVRIRVRGGATRFARRIAPFSQETVEFKNRDVTLRGKLLVPRRKGPFPAVVLAHGSGSATRNMGFYDSFFATLGMAVLSFDKRGAGESTGDWRAASFEDLASDILAGVALLEARPEIERSRIGIHGGSQGGWIGSLAAARSGRVRFLMVTCGSGVTVAENIVHEDEGRMREAGLKEEDVKEGVALARTVGEMATRGEPFERMDTLFQAAKTQPWAEFVFPAGLPKDNPWWSWFRLNGAVDSAAALKRTKIPVLWFLGDRDWNVPSAPSKVRIQAALLEAGNPNSLVKTLSPASHMLLEARTGHDDEREFMTRFVPGYWDGMEQWIRKNVLK